MKLSCSVANIKVSLVAFLILYHAIGFKSQWF